MGGRWRGREGGREGRTSRKETVLAEDGHGVDEEKDDIEDPAETWHDWRSVGGLRQILRMEEDVNGGGAVSEDTTRASKSTCLVQSC